MSNMLNLKDGRSILERLPVIAASMTDLPSFLKSKTVDEVLGADYLNTVVPNLIIHSVADNCIFVQNTLWQNKLSAGKCCLLLSF
jgi:hypothetical protein